MVKQTTHVYNKPSAHQETHDTSTLFSIPSYDMSSTSTITDRFRSNTSTSDYNGHPSSYTHPLPSLHTMYPDRGQIDYETRHRLAYSRDASSDRSTPVSRTSRPMTVSSLLTSDEPSIPNPSRYQPPSIQPPPWAERNDHGDVSMTDSSPKLQTAFGDSTGPRYYKQALPPTVGIDYRVRHQKSLDLIPDEGASTVHSNSTVQASSVQHGPSKNIQTKARVSRPPPINFQLTIRQQPIAARACGFGERDRRVIDPPPIVELKTFCANTGAPITDHTGMLALHCTLINHLTEQDESDIPPAHPGQTFARRLMGTLVSSPNMVNDEKGRPGIFFVFPDLSCRTIGPYRMRFRLMRVEPRDMEPGTIFPCVANCITDVFNVYTAKDFPGMMASSVLLKALRTQGVIVGVKKGSENSSKGRRGKEDLEDEDMEDDDDGSVGGGDSIDAQSSAGNSVRSLERKLLSNNAKRPRRRK